MHRILPIKEEHDAEPHVRLPFDSRDVGEGQLEARGRHRRADASTSPGPFLPESLAGVNGDPLPESPRRSSSSTRSAASPTCISSAWWRSTSCPRWSTTSRRRARGRLRAAGAPSLRRGGSEAHPALPVVRGGVRDGVRHACGVIGPAEEIAAAILNALPAGRVPHHPAHRVDDPEALRGIGEGQRRRAARPALLQPAQAPLARGEPARQARHADRRRDRQRARAGRRSRRASTTTWTSASSSTAGCRHRCGMDLESLQKAIGRVLTPAERAEIEQAQTEELTAGRSCSAA